MINWLFIPFHLILFHEGKLKELLYRNRKHEEHKISFYGKKGCSAQSESEQKFLNNKCLLKVFWLSRRKILMAEPVYGFTCLSQPQNFQHALPVPSNGRNFL